ncbi:PRTRC system protein B [Rugamonas sp. A1-17]|nr:PRTRC system protein B [Rugamonas sp. A1-17]
MNIHIDSGSEKLVLRHAILMYESQSARKSRAAFASFHEVQDVGTPEQPMPQIMSGTPLTQEALMQSVGSLADRYALNVDLLPESMLSFSPLHMIWWVPSGERRVFLNTAGDGHQSAIVPHPPLLFAVVQRHWYVFAIKENIRPCKATQLYHAPFFNMFDDDSVCTGTANTPKSLLPSETSAWENAFFNSVFTHVNGKKKVTFKGGEFALWRELIGGKHKTFPNSALLKNNMTLGVAMTSLLTFGKEK